MRGKALLCIIGLLAVLLSSVATADTTDAVASIRSGSLLFETFDDDDWESRWKHSSNSKYTGRFVLESGKNWTDKGLKIPERNMHYGLTALLPAAVDPVVGGTAELPLVVQYEVRYSEGVTCGGAYLKLLSAPADGSALDPAALHEASPYSIMFGPDKCGGPGKVHLIFRHRHATNGSISEKHLAAPPAPEADDHSHVYTLRINADHTYEILIDGTSKASGSLLAAGTLAPPLLPPAEIPDPEDKKPADWVDVAKIPDPSATRPEDWDEREKVEDESAKKPKGWLDDEAPLIPDPAAKKPADWDEKEDGEWEPPVVPNPRCRKAGCGPWKRPLVANPAFKGAWEAPLIDNPAYKGPWVQRRIPNPDHYEDAAPLSSGVAPIAAVALELWTIDAGYLFDNLLITRDPRVAERAREALWRPRHEAEALAFEQSLKEKVELEKEREAKEREGKKKKGDASSRRRRSGRARGSEFLVGISEAILSAFDEGALLSPLAPLLAPALDWLRANPEGIVLFLGTLPLMLASVLLVWRMARPREAAAVEEGEHYVPGFRSKARKARAGDSDADDDAGAEGEGKKGGGKSSAVEAAAEGEEGAAAGEQEEEEEGQEAAPAARVQEITPEAEEEEEEAGEAAAAGARRRTRRAA